MKWIRFQGIFIVLSQKSILSHIIGVFVSPNAAGVVFWACDNGVTLVVEWAREDLVGVAFELLKQLSCLAVP